MRQSLRPWLALAACLSLAALLVTRTPSRRILQLPPGTVELTGEMQIDADTEVRGAPAGTTLRAANGFRGRALLVCRGNNIRLTGFRVDGNREALETRSGLAPWDKPFAWFTPANGVLAEHVAGITVDHIAFRNMAGFAVLVSRARSVTLADLEVSDSGSRNAQGRNNATGGILLEEGTSDFQVLRCTLSNIRGNGIWTHSLYASPRNSRGLIAFNRFRRLGRDAIQVGHAEQVTVADNSGSEIGYPVELVDLEARAIPVAIDTAGDTSQCRYTRNSFEEVNGKCVDLDGFHDGSVTANFCRNRQPVASYPLGGYGIVMNNTNPDMQSERIAITDNELDGMRFGAVFLIGSGHTVARNRFRNLNTERCGEDPRAECSWAPNQPDLLRSGIYLGWGAERSAPSKDNLITGNEISGFGMDRHCVEASPGVSRGANRIARNRCTGSSR